MNLNGYTLKAVKTMNTLDGIAYSGNIYYDGRKIGMACNNGCGGMTEVHVMPGIADRASHYVALTEDVVERLFTLRDYERVFKAETKNRPEMGMAFVKFSEPFDSEAYVCGKNMTADALTAHICETKPGCKIESIDIFRSPDDFNISESQQQEMSDGTPVFTDGPGEDFGGMTMAMQQFQ